MEAVLAAWPVNGSRLRKTVYEREAVEQKSKYATRKGKAGNRNLEPTEEEITQAAPSQTKGPTVKSRKVKSTLVLK